MRLCRCVRYAHASMCVLMCFAAISTQRWPEHLNPPIPTPVLADDMPFTPALPAPAPPERLLHIQDGSVYSSKLRPICSIKNNLIKTVYKAAHGTGNQTAVSFAPCTQLCLYRLEVEGYSRVWNYLFARWKSLEKPFEYANSGQIKSCWWVWM